MSTREPNGDGDEARHGDEGPHDRAKDELIKILDLSDNRVGPEGVKAFAEHPTLTHLNLSENTLTDESVAPFQKTRNLTDLVLCDNNITTNGLIFLLKNDHLNTISLYGNQIYLTTLTEIQNSSFITSDNQFFSKSKRLEDTPTQLEPNITKVPVATLQETTHKTSHSSLEVFPIEKPFITSQFDRSQEANLVFQEGQNKAETLISHPDFVEFFHTASMTQINYFLEQLKKDCLQIQNQRKKQRLD